MNRPNAIESLSTARKRFGPRDFVQLYAKPREFFTGVVDAVSPTLTTLFVAYLVGVASTVDRFDTQMARSDVDASYSGTSRVLDSIAASWGAYWIVAIFGGVISAIFFWYIAGWWYRKRLLLSGAASVDPVVARSICAWQFAATSIPSLVVSVWDTLIYASYRQSWEQSSAWATLLLIFPFWSVWISYTAATTQFALKIWLARAWFIFLPVAFYLFIFGFLAIAYAGFFS
jgi:hypothetical protein